VWNAKDTLTRRNVLEFARWIASSKHNYSNKCKTPPASHHHHSGVEETVRKCGLFYSRAKKIAGDIITVIKYLPSGQGVIPDRRYSPRACKRMIRCNYGADSKSLDRRRI
jgi:hypothetical protein